MLVVNSALEAFEIADEVGLCVWELLERDCSWDDIVLHVSAGLGLEPDSVVVEAVREFLSALVATRLVEVVEQ